MIKGNHKVIESLLSLFSINVLGYVLGFITFPYLTRILGVERFGAISFSQVFCAYFTLITNYAFNITAAKEIAMNKNNNKQAEIFMSVMGAKVLLFFLATCFFLIIINTISRFQIDKDIYLATYITVVGDVIFPVWFFQGIEKMRYITYANFIARCLSVIGIFVLVKDNGDTVFAALLLSFTNVIAGIYAFFILWNDYRYLFIKPNAKCIFKELQDGWQMFYSTIAVSLYTGINVLLLGFYTNNEIVGYYSGAQKIMQAAKNVIDTASTAIFPHTSSLLLESKDKAIVFLKKSGKIMVITSLSMSLIGFIYAEYLVDLLLGNGFEESVKILKIIVWIPFIVSFTNIYLIQIIIPFGYNYIYSRIVATSAFINMLIIGPLIYFYQGGGVAIAMIITEIYVACLAVLYVYKKIFIV